MQQRVPHGHLISPEALAGSSPLPSAGTAPLTLANMLPVPRRRVTGRELVAERRKQRAEEKRRAGVGGAGGSGK